MVPQPPLVPLPSPDQALPLTAAQAQSHTAALAQSHTAALVSLCTTAPVQVTALTQAASGPTQVHILLIAPYSMC